jgi:alpha-beta hydrolase superfamily lysophospholipase
MKTDLKKTDGDYYFRRNQCSVYYRKLKLNKIAKNREYNLFVFHDFGEHGERYVDFIEKLTLNLFNSGVNITSYILDLPGHGKSAGPRGHISSIENISLDIVDFINGVQDKNENMLLGNSLGALIVFDILHSHESSLDQKTHSAMTLNPAFKMNWHIPNSIQKMLTKKIGLLGKLRLPFAVDGLAFHGEDCESEEFDRDPLVCHYPTISTFLEIQNAGKRLRTSSYYIEYPVFVGISEDDQLYSPVVSELFSQGLKYGNVKKYYKAPHDLICHQIAGNLVQDIVKWYLTIKHG